MQERSLEFLYKLSLVSRVGTDPFSGHLQIYILILGAEKGRFRSVELLISMDLKIFRHQIKIVPFISCIYSWFVALKVIKDWSKNFCERIVSA